MLVEQHVDEVYRIAAAIVGSDDASDVMQETFVTAWQQLDQLRDPAAFRPWLRRICANRARNWLRSSRQHRSVGSLELGADMPDRRGSVDGAVEARMVLEPAFDRLHPDQRAVLALHYGLGLSLADAADALGVPVGTAKSRLSAGLRVLRSAIEPAPLASGAETSS